MNGAFGWLVGWLVGWLLGWLWTHAHSRLTTVHADMCARTGLYMQTMRTTIATHAEDVDGKQSTKTKYVLPSVAFDTLPIRVVVTRCLACGCARVGASGVRNAIQTLAVALLALPQDG